MDHLDFIVFMGQSNMQGQSDRLIRDLPVPNAWEYRFFGDTAVPLQDPVGEDVRTDGTPGYRLEEGIDIGAYLNDHALGSACYGHTTLVPAFCRAYTACTGHRVLAVHAARGSTTAAQWLPGTPGFAALQKKAAAAYAYAVRNYQVDSVFAVWLQGESDAVFGTSAQDYTDRLHMLFTALQGVLPITRCGIIRVGRFAGDARDDTIIGAQERLCEENPFFVMLTREAAEMSGNPQWMNPNVAGHYSAMGLQHLGAVAGSVLYQKAAGR